MINQSDSKEGEVRRDTGIAEVLSNESEAYKAEWRRRVMRRRAPFLFEEIRLSMERDGFRPHHHNVAGGLARYFNCRGLVTKVGERKSADPTAHARTQPLFVVTRNGGAA